MNTVRRLSPWFPLSATVPAVPHAVRGESQV
jgi:hypothetical protein